MTAKTPNPVDNDFQAFLDEVEQLSVRDGASAADGKSDGRSTAGAKTKKKTTADAATSRTGRKGMIANADDNRRAWSEFEKLDLSRGEGGKSVASFRIKGAGEKKKGKKNGKKKKSTDEDRADGENRRAAEKRGVLSPESTISPLGVSDINDGSCYRCPRWTIIIDTCCLLDGNGPDVQSIIGLANRANLRLNHQQSGTPATAAVDEPIDVVIPFKVWSELEYQSKSGEPGNAYAARSAMRTLRDELERGGFRKPEGMAERDVVRSQSLSESRDAAAKFLPRDSPSTNDDHILACAMVENEAFGSDSLVSGEVAGGVVVVTLDNNLACKGYANGLKVFSPSKFHEYYCKRMSSLRQRTTGNLVDSALRR